MSCVVVGPGAMGFYALLGALHSRIDLDSVKEISGSSAGALASLCFILHVPLAKCMEVEVKSIIKPSIKTFLKDYGFVSRDKAFEFLKEFFGRDYTFKELYEITGKIFHMSVSSLTYSKVVYVSVLNSPNDSVLDTLVTSISIPFLFVPKKMKHGEILVDGSVFEYIPGGPFIGREDDVTEISLVDPEFKEDKKRGLMLFFFQTLRSLMGLRHTYYYKNRLLVKFHMDDCYDFSMSQDKKMEAYKRGFLL